MANYRKSFNFRDGVQVDDDNFLVNSSGLVGIGTTIPTETLDVRGNLKVVGLATVNEAHIGIGTADDFRVGITSINSGIITAVTGVVTYYGDGSKLLNLPSSQWVDVDVGLGFTSIYAQGNVGVSTEDPRFTFQVGYNPNDGNNGVGISSAGNIILSGILTATKLYGWGIGVTGLNAGSAIAAGTLDNDRLPSTISVTKVVAPTLTGIASTARNLTSDAEVDIETIKAGLSTAGISTIHSRLSLETGAKLALGLENTDSRSDLQVRNTGIASISVVSDSEEAQVLLGKTIPGVGSSYGFIQFGNNNSSYTASNIKSLDIINNDTGSIVNYLHFGPAGINTGNWKWIYGQTLAERMTLTWDGKLGINQLNPEHALHVVGTSTITGYTQIGAACTVSGDLGVGGNIYFNDNATVVAGIISASSQFIGGGSLKIAGKVGIATNILSTNYELVVGSEVEGVGIGSTGTINAPSRVTTGTIQFDTMNTNGKNITFGVSGSQLTITVAGVGATVLDLG